MSVAIINTGGANINSVVQALNRLDMRAELTSSATEIKNATHIILPGVGAAGAAMKKIASMGIVDLIRDLKKPTLGICLGMQLLFESSEENDTACLGIIPGRVTHFAPIPGRSIPHMGWNRVDPSAGSKADCLFAGIDPGSHFYFVHSFRAPNGLATAAITDYREAFPSVVAWENFYGVQFHPEKSSVAGARLLRNFLSL